MAGGSASRVPDATDVTGDSTGAVVGGAVDGSVGGAALTVVPQHVTISSPEKTQRTCRTNPRY